MTDLARCCTQQCTPYQDWQVLVAIRSHEMLGFPGPIVRLMACNDDEYEPAASSYDKYSVVRVHDYDTGDDYPDDYFPPRNKANNLRDWLAMDGGPDDDDVIGTTSDRPSFTLTLLKRRLQS